MAMVLTPQKPTQRTRLGELPEGLPESTLERGRRGEQRQELGRPVRFLLREGSVAGQGKEQVPGQPGRRKRVPVRSPVRENRTPGSVRGASGNRRPYRDGFSRCCCFLQQW